MNNKTCCFTGHRPEKLKSSEEQIKELLNKEIQIAIADGITVFISGMARGVDLWAARLVLDLKKESPDIRLICAIPYQGFEKRWPPAWQALYRNTLVRADDVNVFYPSFTYASFQERNRWMVNHSVRVIAVYNGQRGGTRNTIGYAKTQNVRVCIIPG